ncbi:hypothetical protein SK128_006307 [Halocaridina rubra]|uniref:Uncharacterized protein n=1 Tax=Halocaridina rubra TaxID=373956 RepID=A0AAN8WSJ2_HALRR
MYLLWEQAIQVTAFWRARKQLCILNLLSRAPFSRPTPEDETECDVRCIVTCKAFTTVDKSSPPTELDRALQELQAIARVYPTHEHLFTCVTSGFLQTTLTYTALSYRNGRYGKISSGSRFFMASGSSFLLPSIAVYLP